MVMEKSILSTIHNLWTYTSGLIQTSCKGTILKRYRANLWCMSDCTKCVPGVFRDRRVHPIPGTGVIGGCVMSYECSELNLGKCSEPQSPL